MKVINVITIVTLVLFYFSYNTFFCKSDANFSSEKKKEKKSELFYITIGVALLLRIICGVVYKGYETDINCFMGWSSRVFEEGFANFYSPTSFSDYPPGYIYVLYVIGGIRKVLNLDFSSLLYILILKLPAIICDIITANIIYKVAKKHSSEIIAVVCAALYLFNPAIILNSAIWGQVDSIFTLAVVFMCYYIYQKKLPIAYFVFAIGILIKPQVLIFTPILIYGIIDQVFLEDFSVKKLMKQLMSGILAILFMIALMLPFGLDKVITQYKDTLVSYPHASCNAYNFWAMLGVNWMPQNGKLIFLTYNQWGSLFIVLIVVVATYFSFKYKKQRSKYFVLAAFIVVAMFTLSVRMHERYMFPALVLLLIGFILRPCKELFLLYTLYSVVHFYNVAHVLFVYDVYNFNPKEPFTVVMGTITVFILVLMSYILLKRYIKSGQMIEDENGFEALKPIKNNNLTSENKNSKKTFFSKNKYLNTDKKDKIRTTNIVRITKIDLIPILIITILYACIALYDLGNKSAPQTAWDTNVTGDSVIIDLGEEKEVSKISYFLGNYENRQFKLQYSSDINGPFEDVNSFEMTSVFAWGTKDVHATGRYFKLISTSDKTSVRELVLLDRDGNRYEPVNRSQPSVSVLFDEQDIYPERSTFRDSTYFDEIYHARTAYEFTQGLYSYENTHPPLGKVFISIGMLIFGVNPFGWRIMGTLFGIAMIPFIYLFAKKLLKKTWVSTIVCAIFAFDFMHFTQTRIATIDVFVTFFIILMYYFMYQYYEMSFYDTSLKKTFIPLGLCGIAMGFGVASKWTGAYAGVGLAILFFITLYRRYQEYKIALSNPAGSTNGIEHKHIIDSFFINVRKTILFCCIFFVVIPIVIYTLSYIPFNDGQGSGLITRMIKNAFGMYDYHSKVDATHPFSSWWYEWPTIVRPIWYYSGTVSSKVSEGISAFGNPLVWWTGIPAFVYMIYLVVKKKDEKALFLSISYLAQYLPWILVTRIVFIYHYFPSVPFVALMIGYSIYDIVNRHPKYKKVAYAYTVLVIILFIMFYPVLSGQPVNKDYVSTWLRWFESWILVS